MTKDIKSIVYFGTPSFAVAPLQALIQSKYTVKAVVTQPDRPAGRGKKLHPPEVKVFAQEQGIEVLQPEKITKDILDILQGFNADVFVVCAYGKILSQKLIDLPMYIINIHASILPAYRGAAPIHQSIKNGDNISGVSIMKIVKELDAGDVMLVKEVPIEQDDNLEDVTIKLSKAGSLAIIEALDTIKQGKELWVAQDHKRATYAHKMYPDDACIEWNQTCSTVHNFIRSYAPSPGAFTDINGEKIKIIKTKRTSSPSNELPGSIQKTKKNLFISCSDYWLEVLQVQPLGKKIMDVKSFMNGYRKELTKCD